MKRRYTILFFIALSPLIGLSWLAARFDFSLWSARSIGLVGMVLAAVIAAVAMASNTTARWPAGVAGALLLLPNGGDMFRVIADLGTFFEFMGVPSLVLVFGWLATLAATVVIAILPVPPLPSEPQVAPARVVD